MTVKENIPKGIAVNIDSSTWNDSPVTLRRSPAKGALEKTVGNGGGRGWRLATNDALRKGFKIPKLKDLHDPVRNCPRFI